ncbi:MAG: hypothetical protein RR547_02870 [Raoultibacter sp.]
MKPRVVFEGQKEAADEVVELTQGLLIKKLRKKRTHGMSLTNSVDKCFVLNILHDRFKQPGLNT